MEFECDKYTENSTRSKSEGWNLSWLVKKSSDFLWGKKRRVCCCSSKKSNYSEDVREISTAEQNEKDADAMKKAICNTKLGKAAKNTGECVVGTTCCCCFLTSRFFMAAGKVLIGCFGLCVQGITTLNEKVFCRCCLKAWAKDD